MSIDMSGWSNSKKSKYFILSRAFSEFRGWEAILLIQWRIAAERRVHEHNYATLAAAKAFEIENEGQPQAVRALNLQCERLGQVGAYKYNIDDPAEAEDNAGEKSTEEFFDEMEAMSSRQASPKIKLN